MGLLIQNDSASFPIHTFFSLSFFLARLWFFSSSCDFCVKRVHLTHSIYIYLDRNLKIKASAVAVFRGPICLLLLLGFIYLFHFFLLTFISPIFFFSLSFCCVPFSLPQQSDFHGCPAVFDSVKTCWPSTPLNTTAQVPCFTEFLGINYDSSREYWVCVCVAA